MAAFALRQQSGETAPQTLWPVSTEKKKCTEVENCVLFGGQAEDLSPGGSLLDSSEGLL